MKKEIVSQRADVLIRRHILEPGEALPWHTDRCHRFTVTLSGDALGIEYRDEEGIETIAIHPGMTGWDSPQDKVHRGINIGKALYEEVVIFFLDEPGMEPQPEAS